MMILDRRRGRNVPTWVQLLLLLESCSRVSCLLVEANNGPISEIGDLEGAGSDPDAVLSATESHKIIASGWPSTSPMWPTIDVDEETAEVKTKQWFRMIEPFIYADKPRTGDYSLLLKINSTVFDVLKAHMKPMSVNLSFEYYFNHDAKSTALPLIKIEVNRKEFRYLDPNGENVKSRRWMKFNERIQIVDLQQLEKHDWLKISLVNRDEPSIVALRRLQVQFRMSDQAKVHTNADSNLIVPNQQVPEPDTKPPQPTQYESSSLPPASTPQIEPSKDRPTNQDEQSAPVVTIVDDSGGENEPIDDQQQPGEADSSVQPLPVAPAPSPGRLPDQPIQQPPYLTQDQSPPITGADLQESASDRKSSASTKPMSDEEPASDPLSSTIKPVAPAKKKGWGWPGKKRRRRDIGQQTTGPLGAPNGLANGALITLTCHRSDDCCWQSDVKGEPIQWSLARMPTSTSTVQAGYYYVSNRNNYGDSSKLLKVSLNQTERATIAAQNSDHCIELAIYVTERTSLNMYRLTRTTEPTGEVSKDEESRWSKGNLLMSWAPTMALNDSLAQRRVSLPGSKLAAMESGQNGWTVESLCFGDFFVNPKECGSGNCAFGFVMNTDTAANDHHQHPSGAALISGGEKVPDLDPQRVSSNDGSFNDAEQVVGVSILRRFSQNIPIRSNTLRWLETWQRDEVGPGDRWRFYPKLDYRMSQNNVTLVNLFDDAHYHIESDWLHVGDFLNLTGTLLLEDVSQRNSSQPVTDQHHDDGNIFTLKTRSRLVDSKFNDIFVNESTFNWNIFSVSNGSGSMSINMDISDRLRAARGGELRRSDREEENLFKIVVEFVLDLHWLTSNNNELSSEVSQYLHSDGGSRFQITFLNVSVSDRCYPNQCEHGSCQQNGTGLEDWSCSCEDRYRGRRCDFGNWCSVPHVSPWNPTASNQKNGAQVTLRVPTNHGRQPKMAQAETIRVTGEQFCKSKLGPGYRCTDIDLPLNDNLYHDEDKTFYCSCKSDYYLGDDSKCRQTHACNSVLCPSIGMICDESKPFNQSQPCHCNEKQDWFPDPDDPQNRCIRRQCHNKQLDCGFDAHLCIPNLPGERPICKCGPKFTLKTDDGGKKYCQSMACVLPTLNECQQICIPDNSNTTKPYTCACHPGFQLDPLDGRSCRPERAATKGPQCRPSCPSDTQVCTDHGCRCKPGFVGEGEQKVRRMPKGSKGSTTSNGTSPIEYTESIRCLNICSLSYAENKEEFEMIESVCPLGLCDPNTFQCKCSDPASGSLANEKYEPIYANCSGGGDTEAESDPKQVEGEADSAGALGLVRVSPLCHLKRVCDPESSSHKVCKSQGAICVPDYTKAAKFDCVCPPSTEKRFYGQATVSEFTCESKCSSKKSDCLRKQAVCKQIDRDQVRCDCLPGFMLQDNVCYLAKYSYSMNLILANKYYEPEARFYRLIESNSTAGVAEGRRRSPRNLCPTNQPNNPLKSQGSVHQEPDNQQAEEQDLVSDLMPQFNRLQGRVAATTMTRSIFIADYNQCNITQVIPKSVVEDPYEHDIESYLGYIEQCNEKVHQNMRNYHLNSRLGEDIRQSLRQHLREFTVTTNNSSCVELDPSGLFLNCTIYLQSNEPIQESTIDFVFNDCEKNAHDNKYCWIKPRLLLVRADSPSRNDRLTENLTDTRLRVANQYNFKQVVPCEVGNFCGTDAVSVRVDDRTSLCSCKCPNDVEVVDVKDLEPRGQDDDPSKVAVKETCAPRNHCGANSTHCLLKSGSVCQYDIRTGSRCICVHPFYEDSSGQCVEVAFGQLNSTLVIIIIMLGTALLVSVFLNILVAARTRSMFGKSKQYPLNEFSSPSARPMNRSTGVPNPVFEND